VTKLRALDWLVLGGTIFVIVAVGLFVVRRNKSRGFLQSGAEPFWVIGLSTMATQASAVTFLSTPGQGFADGLGFVQFYFGLPAAMVIIAFVILPIYMRLKVTTAYEYLEGRFDKKTRRLTAALFLLQRGLGAGLSLYAPAIVFSALLGWPLPATAGALGVLIIAYTVSGGARAVSATQTLQMAVMLGGMAAALVFIVRGLPVSLGEMTSLGSALGRTKAVDTQLDWTSRYNIWAGIIGGTFLQLAYFGTDQSQVQRYLTGAGLRESRLGLLMNGVLKIPMQLGILFVGVAVAVFYCFEKPPIHFNSSSPAAAPALQQRYDDAWAARQKAAQDFVAAERAHADTSDAAHRLADADRQMTETRAESKKQTPRGASDDDYIFLRYVLAHFPAGLIGLLLAVVLCAAMSSTAAALSALGTTTVVDFFHTTAVRPARLATAGWALFAVGFAGLASLGDNLIQAVNIIGSIFYGPTLGVFLAGFFVRRINGNGVFIGLLVAQIAVIALWATTKLAFLWYNLAGCLVVLAVGLAFSVFAPSSQSRTRPV
jgi:SSS family transporter